MKEWKTAVLALAVAALLGGCKMSAGDTLKSGTGSPSSRSSESVGTTAPDYSKSSAEGSINKASSAPLGDIERSNRFYGGHVVLAGEYVYMSIPDSPGLYRVSADGKAAERVSSFPAFNLTYWDGYVYYNSYKYDSAPARFCRVAAGGTEEEVIDSIAFESFFILDSELYYYGKVGDTPAVDYYEVDRKTLYRAPIDDPDAAQAVYSGKYIARAWAFNSQILMLAHGNEMPDPPGYEMDIVRLDPQSGDWQVIHSNDGFLSDVMPYKDIFIMEPHVFDVFPGNDCILYGWDPEYPKAFVFDNLGSLSLGGTKQYALKGDWASTGEFSEHLIQTENWGKSYDTLLDLNQYVSDGYFPEARIYQAGDCLYIYICPHSDYDRGDWIIVRYNLNDGTHGIMDIFD